MAAAVSFAIGSGSRAVLVMQGGVLVAEQYQGQGRVDRGELLASGTKSFSCALAAAAEADGFMRAGDLASIAISAWAPGGASPDPGQKQTIRLDNLLSMTGGLSNTGASALELNNVDSFRQAITARSGNPPDEVFTYGPNSFQAFAAAFELATGGSLTADLGVTGGQDSVSYLQTRVLNRIGIAPTQWLRDIRGHANWAGGAYFTARAWATYGQFILQKGAWQGEQVVPAALIERCSTYRNGAFLGYGLGFWLNRRVQDTFTPGVDSAPWPTEVAARFGAGSNIAPNVPESMFMAFGAGNVKMFILPSHEIVAVKIGGTQDDDRFLALMLGTAP
ncbi:MAG: serine hydrolase domain-containing protein [Brevundimonas sp.]|uniref:serine hydrolase domain-containing protein n=1 Tax=Brevundimonas sp. TaxID=1871086 RepID=UPI0022BF9B35|nr:serine hydrolase [Brevundimonas sp.]MCZ8085916.1 serine hydrolase [Brevundimonas sp.]MCZ8194816.1 serine hydrolase [Brevundimonas sp.]